VVVTALALTIHGKDLGSAVLKAIKLNAKYGGLVSFPELMGDNSEMTKAKIKRKVLQLCRDSIRSLNLMASSEYVSNAMSNHPEAPCTSVVKFVSPFYFLKNKCVIVLIPLCLCNWCKTPNEMIITDNKMKEAQSRFPRVKIL
jgi:hypothetical protein